MPSFPSYDGPPLPAVLNPLNPRHYLMLADWIFFKPSRLKQYLYRADPEIYFESGWSAMIGAWRLPAYRNLWLMLPVLILLISAVASAAVSWTASAAQETAVDWAGVANGVAGGVAGGVAVSVLLGVMFGVAGGVAGGVAMGVAGGVAMGVAFGVAFGVVFGVAVGVAGGVAMGVAMGVMLGVMFGVAGGVAVGVVLGVAMGVMFGVMFGVAGGVPFGVAFGVACGVGALRGVFYAFQVGPSLWRMFRSGSPARRLTGHPALGDELAVLPFPGLGALLAAALAEDFPAGLRAARFLLRNPFQRWAVTRGFSRFLSMTPDPLVALYRALGDPLLAEYWVEPALKWQSRFFPPAWGLWLGELAGVFVDPVSSVNSGNSISEKAAWAVTRPLRGQPDPRIAPLARLLLSLHREKVAEDGPAPALLQAATAAVQSLPHGEEVALSLTVLARLAAVEDIESVAKARRGMGWLDRLAETPLRPQVLEALRGLGDVSAEVALFRQATNPATQAAALNRAVGMLNELAEYVEGIVLPERALLRLAVQRWQSLVAEAAGRLGERTLREMAPSARRALSGGERRAALWSRPAAPFPNPYQTGDPVVLPLFVGRGDIFSRIREIWASKAAPDSIILYGHRRMGKSSILRNLGEIAPAGSLLVREDLKGETAFAEGLHSLLLGLADAVAWMAQDRGLDVPEPSPGDYATSDAAAHAFRRLLRRVLAALPEEASLILALDEFEAVDDAVRKGKIEQEIYDYLRALSQQPRIVLVFAGLHTLDEMSRDYRAAFFGAYVNIRVSYLAPEAAERLIARPTPNFLLNYDPVVVARIIHETHGQPLLLQRICQELVNHVNHELFDLEVEREARVLPEDLKAVLSDDFVRGETRYFDGIWQDQISGRAAEEATLQALSGGPATASELVRATDLADEEVAEALDYLKKRDLVARDADSWDILVPLMRRWLRLREENAAS